MCTHAHTHNTRPTCSVVPNCCFALAMAVPRKVYKAAASWRVRLCCTACETTAGKTFDATPIYILSGQTAFDYCAPAQHDIETGPCDWCGKLMEVADIAPLDEHLTEVHPGSCSFFRCSLCERLWTESQVQPGECSQCNFHCTSVRWIPCGRYVRTGLSSSFMSQHISSCKKCRRHGLSSSIMGAHSMASYS